MYQRINDVEFTVKKNIPNQPGIYRIIALDNNGEPVRINRLLDVDESGTLYIGKSENLRKRISNMRRAFSPKHKSVKHIAVRRYQRIKKIEEKYPVRSLVILLELTKDNQSARELEKQELEVYEKFMGEIPPLNRQ